MSEEIMFKSKPNWSILFVAVILSISVGISMIMHPRTLSMEPFMLVAIASMLAGIWSELAKMNKHKSDNNKRTESENE